MSASRVHGLEVLITVRQPNRRELMQTLEGLRSDLASLGGLEEGPCCDVFEDAVEPNRFLWAEWWPTVEGVESSLESQRFKTLLAAIRVLGSVESVRRVASEEPGESPSDGQAGRSKSNDTDPNPVRVR